MVVPCSRTDLEGSIRAVTDSQGQVVARYEYEPFGLTVKAEGPLAGQKEHKFTGKPEDGVTGLYYFGARYYDPEMGRFTSQDPAGQGINWYIYTKNNPLKYVDPIGMWSEKSRWYLPWTWFYRSEDEDYEVSTEGRLTATAVDFVPVIGDIKKA